VASRFVRIRFSIHPDLDSLGPSGFTWPAYNRYKDIIPLAVFFCACPPFTAVCRQSCWSQRRVQSANLLFSSVLFCTSTVARTSVAVIYTFQVISSKLGRQKPFVLYTVHWHQNPAQKKATTLHVSDSDIWLQGWRLDDAVREVKSKRPQAHPYLDCWHTMRTRLTEGRSQEILQMASRLYEERKAVRCHCTEVLLQHGHTCVYGSRMQASFNPVRDLFLKSAQN
jgi:hypothetical protein